MSRYALIEPCCGSGALTLHLLGVKKSLLPYQGAKWKYRKQIEAAIVERGFTEIFAVHLNDSGPWGRTLGVLSVQILLAEVIEMLKVFDEQDPRELYDQIHKHPIPKADTMFAAEHLFLQRLSVNGKAVGINSDNEWRSPGFNKSSAYGTAKSKGFGKIRPLVRYLVETVSGLQGVRWPDGENTTVTNRNALELPLLEESFEGLPRVIYLDPTYAGTTGYPNGNITREEVITAAEFWHRNGATVLISEAEVIPELVEKGWEAKTLREPPTDTKPFQSKKGEYLTISPRIL